MTTHDDVEREATHDWLSQRDDGEPLSRQEFQLEPLADAETRQAAARAGIDPPQVADPAGVVGLVGDLIDNMSSVSPGATDFLVDMTWAVDLIAAVTGERLGEPEHDYSDTRSDGDYPSQPCPEDPDGLHFPGCGCDHDDTPPLDEARSLEPDGNAGIDAERGE